MANVTSLTNLYNQVQQNGIEIVRPFRFKNEVLTSYSNIIFSLEKNGASGEFQKAYACANVKNQKLYKDEFDGFVAWAETIGLEKSNASLYASVGEMIVLPYYIGNSTAQILIDDWGWTISKLAELRPLKKVDTVKNLIDTELLNPKMTQSQIREAVKEYRGLDSAANKTTNKSSSTKLNATKKAEIVKAQTSNEIRAADKTSLYSSIFVYNGKKGAPFVPSTMADIELKMKDLEFIKVAATTWVRDNQVAYCELHDMTQEAVDEFYNKRKEPILKERTADIENRFKSGDIDFQTMLSLVSDVTTHITNEAIAKDYESKQDFFPAPVLKLVDNDDD